MYHHWGGTSSYRSWSYPFRSMGLLSLNFKESITYHNLLTYFSEMTPPIKEYDKVKYTCYNPELKTSEGKNEYEVNI